jgi:ATP-dependent DNA helicase RecG
MEGPKPIKELQLSLNYRSRSQFLNEVINPLMKSGEIYRDGKPKSPTALIKIKR